ncbi:peptidylprolyl isomerase [Paenibacillus sp. GCM10012307]|uniref:Peptidyl-prolyl cis-trans isomerase n=1 Tax=Paenibacillus roseus TaxID=2798579 RepID=A0A934J5X6_9BACL|nr:peptidylprolyl isomerase [Paenibacillus roseus]MBJ6360967.1 peptidylprolyl isomerase [Paenibacillus roseus]
MSKHRKNWTILTLVLTALLVMLTGCGSRDGTPQPPSQVAGTADSKTDSSAPNPLVTIEMDNGEKIQVELYPQIAPNTVNNFIHLIDRGFYDGTIFHRVIKGFMIQGGDPKGLGTGGPGYDIKGEFANNGFTNDLKHTRGVLSMARTQSPDTAGSQFFIMVADSPHLDKEYAAFGKVVEGIDVVDEIVNQTTDASDRPEHPLAMKRVTVNTFGVQYPKPDVIL